MTTERARWPAGRWAAGLIQVVALGAAVWFLVDTGRDNWAAVVATRFTMAWGPLLLASVLTAGTYLFLVRVWVHSLHWWGQRLGVLTALRIWFVGNLARFIPGMVWQFVGIAAMVQAHGVSPVAATAAILLQQIVLLATGVGLVAAAAPALLGTWVVGLPPVAVPALAAAGVVIVIVILPRALPLIGRVLTRLTGSAVTLPAPPPMMFARYVAGLAAPWPVYGIAFWLFGRALFGDAAPGPLEAATVFVGSYVAGLIVVFAPGGIIVREAALVAGLSPLVGGGRALTLAVGSRLWLVALELATALGVILVHRFAQRASPSDGA
ncbi:MAG TPA: lysylphosphatidylglycerol synthase domain-containing protein [Gemmatimonadales bacterium]